MYKPSFFIYLSKHHQDIMTILSHITLKEYRRFIISKLMKSPSVIFISLVGLALVIYYFADPQFGLFYLFAGVLFLSYPIITISSTGKAYKRNKRIHEKITFQLNNESLELSGQTFTSSYQWDQIKKVVETKKYFLIHAGITVLTMINKAQIDEVRVSEFRKFFYEKGKLR
jgi:hypothetical protein